MEILCFLLMVVSLWRPLESMAHPISMSTAVADIYEDHVQIELRILTEDLMFYHSLEADKNQVLTHQDLVKAADAHRSFLSRYFRVFNKDGQAYDGEFTRVDLGEIPETGVRLDQVMEIGVFYEYHIPLDELPEYLTFSQNFGGDSSPVPAVMDLILLQKGARLDFPVQIGPRSPHSVAIDWENPPRNDRMYWKERRDLMKKRREELLGITSYSSTYAYIYVEPYEIRFEILVPLLTLETWLPLEREKQDFLSVEEQQKLKKPLEAYVRSQCNGQIDGIDVVPVLSHLNFFSLDIRDFARSSEPRTIGMQNGRAGIIMTFSTKGTPKSATIKWNGFNDYTPMLNTMVYVMNEKGERHFFTENEPEWIWQSEGTDKEKGAWASLPEAPMAPQIKVSLASLGTGFLFALTLLIGVFGNKKNLIGCGIAGLLFSGVLWPLTAKDYAHPWKGIEAPEIDHQKMIAEAMLKNVYRAFDYKEDGQVYDALSRSAGGPFLEQLYLQIKKGLVLQEQGGARSRVREFRLVSSNPAPSVEPGDIFALEIQWEVTGTVEHWGHIHTRQHGYHAVLQVIAESGQWKIGGMDVKSEEQIKSSTGLRNAA